MDSKRPLYTHTHDCMLTRANGGKVDTFKGIDSYNEYDSVLEGNSDI